MEYNVDGTRVIVDRDNYQYGNNKIRKMKIGANYINGTVHGGYLSSFKDSFKDELISIETGLSMVDAKIGDIKDAYYLLKEKINNIDSNNIYELSEVVLDVVDEYFGGISNTNNRLNYYYDNDYEESKDNKMSNLKGTGAAMCTERAALAQNLLKSLGINSCFKTSGIINNGNKEGHSYNLIEYSNKYYIFDTSIPNVIDNRPNPLIGEIDRDSFELLSNPLHNIGISVTVSHYNPYRDKDVTITYDSGRKKSIDIDSINLSSKKVL